MNPPLVTDPGRWLTLTAWMGLIGAMLMLVGDLLLYAHFENLPVLQPLVADAYPARTSILLASDSALTASALLGPLAACFYLGGSAHYYLLFHRHRALAVFVGVMSAVAFITSGAYHALFGLLGHILEHANSQPIESTGLVTVTQSTLLSVSTAVRIPLLLAFSGLFIGMLMGSTIHLRSVALLTPLIPIIVLVPIIDASASAWPTPWSSIAAGGIYNALMALSFLALARIGGRSLT